MGAVGTSYLLPMDRRLLPFSFRLLPVDARRRVTLWEGQGAVAKLPLPQQLQPRVAAPPSLTPGPETFGESSYPDRWWGWQAQEGWHPGCHLSGTEGRKEPIQWLAYFLRWVGILDLESANLAGW